MGRVSVFGMRRCGLCLGRVGGGLGQGLESCGGVMSVCIVSMDYLRRWQVQVYVYILSAHSVQS